MMRIPTIIVPKTEPEVDHLIGFNVAENVQPAVDKNLVVMLNVSRRLGAEDQALPLGHVVRDALNVAFDHKSKSVRFALFLIDKHGVSIVPGIVEQQLALIPHLPGRSVHKADKAPVHATSRGKLEPFYRHGHWLYSVRNRQKACPTDQIAFLLEIFGKLG
jgi:hypothetical protein